MLDFLNERYWCVEADACTNWLEGVGLAYGALGAGVPMAAAGAPMRYERRGVDAVIPVRGMLLGSRNWFLDYFKISYSVYSEIAQEVTAAAGDATVKRIVLEVDSPGGAAQGCAACAAAIYAARGKKEVVAYCGVMAASAAYYLASQATRVVARPDSLVGSIGCVWVKDDTSAQYEAEGIKRHAVGSGPHKGAFTPGTAISAEHLASVKETVMGLAEQFWAAVERGRGRTVRGTRAVSGEVFLGGAAQGLGLVDSIEQGVVTATEEGETDMSGVVTATVEVVPAVVPVAAVAPVAPVAAVVPVAASIGELRAAFPDDAAYCLDAAERGLTLSDARTEYTRMEAFAAGRVAAVAPVVAPVNAAALGGAEVVAQGLGGSTGGVSGGLDARAMARERSKAEGVTYIQALQATYKEHPELHPLTGKRAG